MLTRIVVPKRNKAGFLYVDPKEQAVLVKKSDDKPFYKKASHPLATPEDKEEDTRIYWKLNHSESAG